MTFSESAWMRVRPWFDAIQVHPFVAALSAGTLASDVFARYLLDDAHYLVGFARALAVLATRAPSPEMMELLARLAAETIASERALHRAFLVPRGLDPDAPGAAEPSPTCRAYVGAVLADASFAPLEIGVAGVLPCFRVYAEVGRILLGTRPAADHPYRQWIDTYADPAFHDAVHQMEAAADVLARDASAGRVEAMLDAYERATRFEWMFWDAAWHGERWPTPGRT